MYHNCPNYSIIDSIGVTCNTSLTDNQIPLGRTPYTISIWRQARVNGVVTCIERRYTMATNASLHRALVLGSAYASRRTPVYLIRSTTWFPIVRTN